MSVNNITIESKTIAAKLMEAIMFDNGFVNRLHPEHYPLKHVNNIALCVQKALELNENLEFDQEVIECMATGEVSEMQALIDHYESFEGLNLALSAYFNDPAILLVKC